MGEVIESEYEEVKGCSDCGWAKFRVSCPDCGEDISFSVVEHDLGSVGSIDCGCGKSFYIDSMELPYTGEGRILLEEVGCDG